MKKLFFSAFMLFATAATFTSCQKEIQPITQSSLSSQIGADADFAKMMNSSITLGSSLAADISEADAQIVASILAKGANATKAELNQLQAILGNNPDDFKAALIDFTTSFQNLENKYSLSKMSTDELTKTIQDAINSNAELKAKLTTTSSINGKAEVTGAAICKLVVLLAKTFGGGALCTAIGVSTVPVVGGVLCTVLITVASNILNAACDLIP